MPEVYSIDSPANGTKIPYGGSFTIEFTAPDRTAADYNVQVTPADTASASYTKSGLVEVGPSPETGHAIYRQTGVFNSLSVPAKTVSATLSIVFDSSNQGNSISVSAIKPPPAPGEG